MVAAWQRENYIYNQKDVFGVRKDKIPAGRRRSLVSDND
jgi:hypothetical protein